MWHMAYIFYIYIVNQIKNTNFIFATLQKIRPILIKFGT